MEFLLLQGSVFLGCQCWWVEGISGFKRYFSGTTLCLFSLFLLLHWHVCRTKMQICPDFFPVEFLVGLPDLVLLQVSREKLVKPLACLYFSFHPLSPSLNSFLSFWNGHNKTLLIISSSGKTLALDFYSSGWSTKKLVITDLPFMHANFKKQLA